MLLDGVNQLRQIPSERAQGASHIQELLIDTEGLHQIGIYLVDLGNEEGDRNVGPHPRPDDYELRAFRQGFPTREAVVTPRDLARGQAASTIPFIRVGSPTATG